jgi:hypothetical protein
MKKIIYITGIIFTLVFSGCTEGFEDINKDKHEFTSVEPEYLLASSVKGSMYLIAELNANMYWQWSHQLTVSSMASPSSYGASYSTINNWWERFYENIALLRQIQTLYGEKAGYENRVQIAKIWESYMFYIFTTTFSGVPYTDACRDDLIDIPFDSETDIYVSLLKTLETASKTLDPAKDALKPDVVFPDSDVNKWKKFAIALRLKIALETQNAIPSESAQHGKDVVTNFESFLLKSNPENLIFKWGGTNSTENSYYYDTYLFNSTKDLPALTHLMFVYMRTYPDPRMQAIFDKVPGHYLIFDTLYTDNTHTTRKIYRYEVPYNGKPKTSQAGGLDEGEGYVEEVGDPYRSMNATQYSYLKTNYLKADGVQNLIWFADICFMQAEAKLLGWGGMKSADTYYNDGISASFEQFGLSTVQATTYKNLNGVKWDTENMNGLPDHRKLIRASISKDPLHKIIVQRWLAGIFHGSHDAYCYIRRTRKIDLIPHFAPTTDANGNGTRVANLPERLQYPNTEISYNGVSYNEAVKRLNGGLDFLSSYLKIAKEYNRKTYDEWKLTSLRINNQAWIKWFGETEQDLVKGGLIKDQTYFIEKDVE